MSTGLASVLGVPLGYSPRGDMPQVETIRTEARWAAAQGFDSFWLAQLFGLDASVALAAVGAEFPEIAEFGTSIVPLYGRHPVTLATIAATASSALDGRFTLGIGPSHRMFVEPGFGESFERPYTRTKEFLEILVPLLRGEAADLDGTEISSHVALTMPPGKCGLVLAALAPRMLRLAGEVTDGTILSSSGPQMIRTHVVPRISEAAAAAGRDAPRVIARVLVCATDDPEPARQAMRETMQGVGSMPTYRAALDIEGVDNAADLMVIGSPDAIVEGLTEYVEAGATDVCISVAAPTPEAAQSTREVLAELMAG